MMSRTRYDFAIPSGTWGRYMLAAALISQLVANRDPVEDGGDGGRVRGDGGDEGGWGGWRDGGDWGDGGVRGRWVRMGGDGWGWVGIGGDG